MSGPRCPARAFAGGPGPGSQPAGGRGAVTGSLPAARSASRSRLRAARRRSRIAAEVAEHTYALPGVYPVRVIDYLSGLPDVSMPLGMYNAKETMLWISREGP